MPGRPPQRPEKPGHLRSKSIFSSSSAESLQSPNIPSYGIRSPPHHGSDSVFYSDSDVSSNIKYPPSTMVQQSVPFLPPNQPFLNKPVTSFANTYPPKASPYVRNPVMSSTPTIPSYSASPQTPNIAQPLAQMRPVYELIDVCQFCGQRTDYALDHCSFCRRSIPPEYRANVQQHLYGSVLTGRDMQQYSTVATMNGQQLAQHQQWFPQQQQHQWQPHQIFQNQQVQQEKSNYDLSSSGHQWQCKHCTVLNDPNTRICHVCSKTSDTVPQNTAKVVQHQEDNPYSSIYEKREMQPQSQPAQAQAFEYSLDPKPSTMPRANTYKSIFVDVQDDVSIIFLNANFDLLIIKSVENALVFF